MSISQLTNCHPLSLPNNSIGEWMYSPGSFQNKSFVIVHEDRTSELVIAQKSFGYVLGESFIKPILDKILEIAKNVNSLVTKMFNFLPVAKADEALFAPETENNDLIGYFSGSCPDGWEVDVSSGCNTIIASDLVLTACKQRQKTEDETCVSQADLNFIVNKIQLEVDALRSKINSENGST